MPTAYPSDLTHWWSPSLDDDGNGTTTLTDLAGSNDGTLTNMDAATDWVSDTGESGIRALDFDGNNDVVVVSSVPSIGTSALSVSVWFKTSAAGRNQLFGVGTTGTAGTMIQLLCEDGVIWVRNTSNTLNGGSGYNDGNWHCLVVHHPASAQMSDFVVLVDGVELSMTASGSATMNYGTGFCRLGANSAGGNPLNGRIDGVRMLIGREFNAAEIEYLSSRRAFRSEMFAQYHHQYQ